MHAHVVAIIQARLTSSRLPQKVMRTILGKTLLELMVERVKKCHSFDDIVIAIPNDPANLPLQSLCSKMGVDCFLGDEADVLSRYEGAAKMFKADVVIRLTSDCPLIDPHVIDLVVKAHLQRMEHISYTSNCHPRTYPRGLDCEVMNASALYQAAREASDAADREHVTRYINMNPDKFSSQSIVSESSDFAKYRFTVDEAADFELVEKIYNELYPKNPNFDFKMAIGAMTAHPEWFQINAHVEQKKE